MTVSLIFIVVLIFVATTFAQLTPQNPTLTILHDELTVNTSFTVSVIPGLSLDIFVDVSDNTDNNSYYFLATTFLYDGDSVDTALLVDSLANLKPSSKAYIPRSYRSKSGSLTLLRTSSEIAFATLFFRAPEIHSSYCPDENNVFAQEGAYLQLSANANGPCLYTILSPCTALITPSNVFTYLNTNATENVHVMVETDENYPLFSFNSSTVNRWNTAFIYGKAFSFKVPVASSVQLVYMYSYKRGPEINNLPSYGIFMTANYGDPSKTVGLQNPLDNGTMTLGANETIVFTLKFFDVSSYGSAWLMSNTTSMKVKKSSLDTEFLFNGPNEITLFLNEIESGHRGLFFDYIVVESISFSTTVATTKQTTSTMFGSSSKIDTTVSTVFQTSSPSSTVPSSSMSTTTSSAENSRKTWPLTLVMCIGSTITTTLLTKIMHYFCI